MPVAFKVRSIKKKLLNRATSRYSPRQRLGMYWQVAMTSAHDPHRSLAIWFDQQAEANRFGESKVYSPSAIMQIVQPPKSVFHNMNTEKIQLPRMDEGSSVPTMEDSYQVSMQCSMPAQRFIDLYYPTQFEADQFLPGREYTVLDIFGTMPSAGPGPTSVAAALAESSAAELAANAAAKMAVAAGQDPTAAAKAAAAQIAASAVAVPTPVTAPPMPPVPQAPEGDTFRPAYGPNALYSRIGPIAWWDISNGGASGRYNGVFFSAGTFNAQANGGIPADQIVGQSFVVPGSFEWYGFFVRS